MGIVYVLTNPAMPGLVKIGHTTQSIEKRMRDLDDTGVPVPFECAAAWEFENAAKIEKTLHRAFADRRVRKTREFFEVLPDQPIAILAEFGAKDVTPPEDVVGEEDPEGDRAALTAARGRRERFSFDMVAIEPGSTLTSVWDEDVTCRVVDDRRVEFGEEITTLSGAAKNVILDLGKNWKSVSGPDSWKYGGETLTARRNRMES